MLDVRRLDAMLAMHDMTTDHSSPTRPAGAKRGKRVALIVLLSVATPIALMLAMMQVGFFLRGGFSPRMDLEQASPDGRHMLRVSHREPFPCVEVLNPPAALTCELIDLDNDRVLDSNAFLVNEESCLLTPIAVWTPNIVTITNLNICDNKSITLSRVAVADPAPN